MIRYALVALGAIVVLGVGFIISSATGQDAKQVRTNQARAFALGVPYTSFNWKTVHAQDRGCNACHDHLTEDVNRLTAGQEKPQPALHSILATGYGIPMRMEDCELCHARLKNCCGAKYFADSVHSLHMNEVSFVRMGGNCNSCHATTRDGKFVLYTDETRYDIVNGVKNSPTPAFTR